MPLIQTEAFWNGDPDPRNGFHRYLDLSRSGTMPKCNRYVPLRVLIISPSLMEIHCMTDASNIVKCPFLQCKKWKSNLELHQHQNVITSRHDDDDGSPLAHACQVQSTSINSLMSYLMDIQRTRGFSTMMHYINRHYLSIYLSIQISRHTHTHTHTQVTTIPAPPLYRGMQVITVITKSSAVTSCAMLRVCL